MQVPNHQNQQAPHPNFWRRNRIWIILLVMHSHGVKVNAQADNSNNRLLTLLLQWVPLLLPAEILYLLLVGCLAPHLHGRSRPPAVRTPA